MYCPHCGQEVSANAKACGHCGQWLTLLSAAPQSPVTPPQPTGVVQPRAGFPGWGIVVIGGLALAFVALLVLLLFLLFRQTDVRETSKVTPTTFQTEPIVRAPAPISGVTSPSPTPTERIIMAGMMTLTKTQPARPVGIIRWHGAEHLTGMVPGMLAALFVWPAISIPMVLQIWGLEW